jgi:RNA polymerase sigma-70 factor (ECF subfamily)
VDVTPEQAFDHYHQAVFSFAYRLTGRTDLAEDITQECFLAFVKAPGRFDEGRGTVKTYLFAIARNLAFKNGRDSRFEAQFDSGDPLETEDPRQNIETSSLVERAVAELPPLQREALILFEYEGFTLEEIAGVAAVDSGTIKSRLHRARERLKRTLAPRKKVGGLHGTV